MGITTTPRYEGTKDEGLDAAFFCLRGGKTVRGKIRFERRMCCSYEKTNYSIMEKGQLLFCLKLYSKHWKYEQGKRKRTSRMSRNALRRIYSWGRDHDKRLTTDRKESRGAFGTYTHKGKLTLYEGRNGSLGICGENVLFWSLHKRYISSTQKVMTVSIGITSIVVNFI